MVNCFLKFVAIVMAMATSSSADMVLRQIHIIMRQGSPTTLLDGDANLPMQTLSEAGEDQMRNLGVWMSNQFRYDASWDDDDGPLTTGVSGLVDDFFPTRVRIESSATETSTLSAQWMASRVFPKTKVPVFMQSKRNDITISSADQCPTFANMMRQLHDLENPDWMEMEASYKNLLVELAAMPLLSGYASTGPNHNQEVEYIPLERAWKVYDLIREAKVYCNKEYSSYNVETCQKLPFPHAADLLTGEEWEDLKKIVHFAEVETKYGNDKSSRLLAGNFLRQIADRMLADEMAEPSDQASKRVYITSADYPLMIALQKAINVGRNNLHLEDQVYPGYGSAFFFELYQDDETLKHVVRVLYKSPELTEPTILLLGDECHEKQTCNMVTFETQINRLALTTQDWCKACGNDSSDACLFYTKLAYQQKVQKDEEDEVTFLRNITKPTEDLIWSVVTDHKESGSECSDKVIREGFLAAFVGGIVSGVVLMGLFVIVRGCCIQRKDSNPSCGGKSSPRTPDTVSSPLGFWKSNLPGSPTTSNPKRNVDFDADGLSLTEEDDDHSSHFTEVAVSPRRPSTHSTIQNIAPSKQAFPPEII